jgi:hypothetical protein
MTFAFTKQLPVGIKLLNQYRWEPDGAWLRDSA